MLILQCAISLDLAFWLSSLIRIGYPEMDIIHYSYMNLTQYEIVHCRKCIYR